MQQRGGFCSGNDLGEARGGSEGCTSSLPSTVLEEMDCGQLSESSSCSVAGQELLWTVFYVTGGGPAQSPALIWLDKAALWAELLLCTSSQPVESCRAKCVALCSLSLLLPTLLLWPGHSDTRTWEEAAAQLSSPHLLIPAVLLPSPAGKTETQKWGSAKPVLCHRSHSNAVSRAAKLHWPSREAQKKGESFMHVVFVAAFSSPLFLCWFFLNTNLESIRYIG